MKKLIMTMFICLSGVFYAACNINVTDYFVNLFGTNTENTMFFVDVYQYNEKNIIFVKDNDLYVKGTKLMGIDPTKFASLDSGYYIYDGNLYYLDKKLPAYKGKIDNLRTYQTKASKVIKDKTECSGTAVEQVDNYLKILNGPVLYKNGAALGKR